MPILEPNPLLDRIKADVEKSRFTKYYVIKNVMYKEYSTKTGFVDIWVLVTFVQNQTAVTALEDLQERSISIEKYYQNEYTDFASAPDFITLDSIRHLLNGYVRSIWYLSSGYVNGIYTPIGKNQNNLVTQMREGETIQGALVGYNRWMVTSLQTVKVGEFHYGALVKQKAVTFVNGKMKFNK